MWSLLNKQPESKTQRKLGPKLLNKQPKHKKKIGPEMWRLLNKQPKPKKLDPNCDNYWINNQNTKKIGPEIWWLLNEQPEIQRELDLKYDEYWTNNLKPSLVPDDYWTNNQKHKEIWTQNVMSIEQITKIWSDQLSVMFYFARTTHFSFVFIS